MKGAPPGILSKQHRAKKRGVCFAFVWFWFFDLAPSPPSYISYEVASHSEMGTGVACLTPSELGLPVSSRSACEQKKNSDSCYGTNQIPITPTVPPCGFRFSPTGSEEIWSAQTAAVPAVTLSTPATAGLESGCETTGPLHAPPLPSSLKRMMMTSWMHLLNRHTCLHGC